MRAVDRCHRCRLLRDEPDGFAGRRQGWLRAGADPNKPTVQRVPYVGVQYAAIPDFQGIGTTVGQQFSAALAGSSTIDAALAAAQSATEREMKRAGYIK